MKEKKVDNLKKYFTILCMCACACVWERESVCVYCTLGYSAKIWVTIRKLVETSNLGRVSLSNFGCYCVLNACCPLTFLATARPWRFLWEKKRKCEREKVSLYYTEIKMEVFEHIKLITAKYYQHLCMSISVDQDQVLVRVNNNLASRNNSTICDIKTKFADVVNHFDKSDPVKWFNNVLRQQQVLQYHCTSTATIKAMEDAVNSLQACTGQNSALSVEIATWWITTAATKVTETILTETDEVVNFEAMLRTYNEKTKRFQANDHPTLQAPLQSFLDWCAWTMPMVFQGIWTRLFFTKSKIAATRINNPVWFTRIMETRESGSQTRESGSHPSASSAKGQAIGLLHALRRPTFRAWSSSNKEGPTFMHTRPHMTLSLTTSWWVKTLPLLYVHNCF